MAYGNHQTKLFLCNVPWDNSYSDTRTFDSPTEQITYFKGSSRRPLYFPNDTTFRFLDGDGTNSRKRDIKVPLAPEDAQSYNYCVYSNDNEETWHYMFISSADYINYETSLLHLEEDLLQNYMFNYELLPSNVVKEIPTTDKFSDYILNEPMLQTGYERKTTAETQQLTQRFYPYAYVSTVYGSWGSNNTFGRLEDLVFSVGQTTFPGYILIFKGMSALLKWKTFCDTLSNYKAKEEIIQVGFVSSMFVGTKLDDLPGDAEGVFIGNVQGETRIKLAISTAGSGYGYWFFDKKNFSDFGLSALTLPKPRYILKENSMDSYTPRHKGLLNSPFMYIGLEVNGQSYKYNTNLFQSTNPTLNLKYYWDNGFKCISSPSLYGGTESINYTQTVELPISATLPAFFSSYWDWVRSNLEMRNAERTNFHNSLTTSTWTTVANTLSAQGSSVMGFNSQFGSVGGTGSSLLTSTVGALGQFANNTAGAYNFERSMEAEAKTARNNQQTISKGSLGGALLEIETGLYFKFVIYQTITGEQAEELDKLYSIMGYDVCKYKVPDINTHQHWDYVQTTNCKIGPNSNPFMNIEAKNSIQNIYNQGVRLWHDKDPGDYGDYSNPID